MLVNDTAISWYSITGNLDAEERGPIQLQDALALLDRYLSAGNLTFEDAEQALATTMFGFKRSNSEFIELCVNGPDQISYRLEIWDLRGPWYRQLFRRVFKHEEELHSREAAVQKVVEFFTTAPEELKRRLERR